MPAMEVRASIFWARDKVRGSESMASTVILRAAKDCISSGFWAGQMKLIRVVPGLIKATSSRLGARTLKTMSDAFHKSAADVTMRPPAAT